MIKSRHFLKLKCALCICAIAMSVGCGANDGTDNTTDNVTEEEIDVNDNPEEDAKGDESINETEEQQDKGALAKLELFIQNKSHSDIADDGTYNSIYSGNYDLIHLSDASKTAYPELSKALQKLNDERETAFLSNYEQMKEDAKQWYEDMGSDGYFDGYSDENNLRVSRADDRFLSIVSTSFSYTGGAHGVYGENGYSYDVKTGQLLKLKDVITDMGQLQSIVKESLKKDYPEASFIASLDESVPENLTGEEDQACSWYLTPSGIDINFGVYLLGSYAEGSQTVQIMYSDHPELFFEGFIVQQGDYIENFDENTNYYTDKDNDGVGDTIMVSPQYDEYQAVFELDITINDNTSKVEAYGYAVKPSMVHVGGNSYLYIDITSENDYRETYAFDIKGNEAKLIKKYDGYITGAAPVDDYDSDWMSYWSVAYYSPDNIWFGKRMDLLSTYSGISKASIDETGNLNIDSYYIAQIYGDYGKLTLKDDLNDCSIIDEQTQEVTKENASIAKGTVLSIYGSNGKDFVDLKDEGGTIYRIKVDNGEWPQTVNGKDIEQLFDGMMFAG